MTYGRKVGSERLDKLEELLKKKDENIEDRVGELVVQTKDKFNELAEVKEFYPEWTHGQTADYMYKVKPQLGTLPELVSAGLTNQQIAEVLGISAKNFYLYKREVPEFAEIYEMGKTAMVEKVEQSLFMLALGDVVVKEELTRSGDIVQLKEYVKPDFRSVKYVLERHGDKKVYGDNQVIEVRSGISDDIKDAISNLNPETLGKLLRAEQAIDITEEVVVSDTEK